MSWSERFLTAFMGICLAGVAVVLLALAVTTPIGWTLLGILAVAALVATVTGRPRA